MVWKKGESTKVAPMSQWKDQVSHRETKRQWNNHKAGCLRCQRMGEIIDRIKARREGE